ncbi:5706_t:CDS:2, partial [Gigaspora margarita]
TLRIQPYRTAIESRTTVLKFGLLATKKLEESCRHMRSETATGSLTIEGYAKD